MRRRDLLATGAVALIPAAGRAQRPQRLPHVGFLFLRPEAELGNEPPALIISSLRDFGWVDGKTVQIESRYGNGDIARLPALAAELVAAKVDVIVSYATGVLASWRTTQSVPIVQATGPDPVALGYATSLAKPGGNVTGSTFFPAELFAKRLEILKDLDPKLVRAGMLLVHNNTDANAILLRALESAGKGLSVELKIAEVGGPSDFAAAFESWASSGVRGVLFSDHDLLVKKANAESLASLGIKHRLPTIGSEYQCRYGALIGYGVHFGAQFRRAAYFVDRILKGAKPRDLPFEQATRFQFLFNSRTAKALEIAIPPSLLARADEVIE